MSIRPTIVIALMAAGLCRSAVGETTILDCNLEQSPKIAFAQIYRVLPTTAQQHARNAWAAGLESVFSEPPRAWVIDTSTKTITVANYMPYWIGEDDGDQVTAILRNKVFVYSRQTGFAALTETLDDEVRSQWKARYGRRLPALWVWRGRCERVVKQNEGSGL